MSRRWAARPRRIRWLTSGIAALVLALVITWVLFVPAADWLARHDVGSAAGSLRETALDDARGRLLTLGAGLFAAGALVFTARNFTLAREGQVTERYTKATEQLGSKELDVRIASIYALERIARDSARDHPTIMEVLTAFIREHSREQWPPQSADGQERERSMRPDVQAAVAVVSRRDHKRDIRSMDLTQADLTSANLSGAFLAGADLSGADLLTANLTGANLTRANLTRANLTRAELLTANLTNADLTNADLTNADLLTANLTRANLTCANLTNANLTSANLIGAFLMGANLAGANLGLANLRSAYLKDADLTGAELSSAKLRFPNLRGVRFSAVFTGADLTGASWPFDVPIPEGWELDTGSDRGEWGLPSRRLVKAHSESGPAKAN